MIEDVSWAFYQYLLREVGDRHLRITYDEGRLEIMSPLPEHELGKYLLGRFVDTLTLTLDIPIASYGSSTLLRKDLAKGVEPDQCYYIKNERRMRAKRRFNFPRDPAPDLVLEVDITNASIDREPIYARLGVPEFWRHDGRRVRFLHRDGEAYRESPTSVAFPFLRASDLNRFFAMVPRRGETAVMKAFAKWVNEAARA